MGELLFTAKMRESSSERGQEKHGGGNKTRKKSYTAVEHTAHQETVRERVLFPIAERQVILHLFLCRVLGDGCDKERSNKDLEEKRNKTGGKKNNTKRG